jgi:hypothetical protein
MLGIGLGANKTPGDFDVMSAISTARGLNGMACGEITDPIPVTSIPCPTSTTCCSGSTR